MTGFLPRVRNLEGGGVTTEWVHVCTCDSRRGPVGGVCHCGGAIPATIETPLAAPEFPDAGQVHLMTVRG